MAVQAIELMAILKVDADDEYWDAASDIHLMDEREGAVSSGRPWWQGSYSLRMWGPEFLPIQLGEGLPYISLLPKASRLGRS